MPEGEEGMSPEDPRPGVTHDGLDLLPAPRLVAVDRALGAGRFVLPKRAAFQPGQGVFEQFTAVRAEARRRAVRPAAITNDHGFQRSPLALQSGRH